MKAVAAVLVFALVLSGCAGSSTLAPAPASSDFTPLQITGPIPFDDSLTDGTPVATSNAGPVMPLFDIPSIPTNYGTLHLLAWGTKDAAGNVLSLLELAVYGFGNPPDTAYAFFDASGRLASLRDNATGLSLELSYDSATQITATLCDANLSAVGHITVAADTGGNPQGQPVDGGSCRLTNAFSIVHTALGTAAATSTPTNVGNLSNIAQLITAGAYVAGFGFGISAILKFKAHKDNPTQVPLSGSLALLFVAASLIFAPAVFQAAGGTLFGTDESIDGVPAFLAPPH
jgi:intracellular multiplication protein IcmD